MSQSQAPPPGKPADATAKPIDGPQPFAPPPAIVRDRNGANGPFDPTNGNRGPDGGGRVTDPFAPAWDRKAGA